MKKCRRCEKPTPKKERNWLLPWETQNGQDFLCDACKHNNKYYIDKEGRVLK